MAYKDRVYIDKVWPIQYIGMANIVLAEQTSVTLMAYMGGLCYSYGRVDIRYSYLYSLYSMGMAYVAMALNVMIDIVMVYISGLYSYGLYGYEL